MSVIDKPKDEFNHWRSALEGNPGPISADEPQCGYYRKRQSKDGPWIPVAIWMHAEQGMVCRVGKEMKDPLDVWTWVAKNPVKKEDAQIAFKTGAWPGDAPPVAAAMGDNNPPSEPIELIPLEVEAADAFLAKVGTIKTQVDSDIASNKVSNLRELRAKADAAHKEEKAPHLAAGRAVDEKYRVREDADAAGKRLLAAITLFQNAERARLQKIADDKAAKERAEWEKQQAAARAKAEAEAASKQVTLEEILEQTPAPPPPKAAEPVKVKSGGASGKAISLRTVKIATITDYAAALNALKDHPDLKSLVQTLCDRACKAGVPLAGVEYSTQQVAA